jgi:O-acetyl-ADP-ribose deacetylase (regulator of RNase III)
MQQTAIEHRHGQCILELHHGDIADEAVDAIVNAANEYLQLGSGVAGSIRRKGGPEIQRECDRLRFCASGHAVMTGAGQLKARHVIHAVGPRMGEGEEEQKLVQATTRCLSLACESRLESIAFPALSSGVFGFPMARCAHLMLSACVRHARSGTALKRIVFVLFDEPSLDTFEQELQALLSLES